MELVIYEIFEVKS